MKFSNCNEFVVKSQFVPQQSLLGLGGVVDGVIGAVIIATHVILMRDRIAGEGN